tara:strand:+ start:94 stop:201 length:108 start_codon:yes stop_codon:yes gene_type:complete
MNTDSLFIEFDETFKDAILHVSSLLNEEIMNEVAE